eukprot:g18954.t1
MAIWILTICCGTARSAGKSSAGRAEPAFCAVSLHLPGGSMPVTDAGTVTSAGATMRQDPWRLASEACEGQHQQRALGICQLIAGARQRREMQKVEATAIAATEAAGGAAHDRGEDRHGRPGCRCGMVLGSGANVHRRVARISFGQARRKVRRR